MCSPNQQSVHKTVTDQPKLETNCDHWAQTTPHSNTGYYFHRETAHRQSESLAFTVTKVTHYHEHTVRSNRGAPTCILASFRLSSRTAWRIRNPQSVARSLRQLRHLTFDPSWGAHYLEKASSAQFESCNLHACILTLLLCIIYHRHVMHAYGNSGECLSCLHIYTRTEMDYKSYNGETAMCDICKGGHSIHTRKELHTIVYSTHESWTSSLAISDSTSVVL